VSDIEERGKKMKKFKIKRRKNETIKVSEVYLNGLLQDNKDYIIQKDGVKFRQEVDKGDENVVTIKTIRHIKV